MIMLPQVAYKLDRGKRAHIIGHVSDQNPGQVGVVFTSNKQLLHKRDQIRRFLKAYKKAADDYHQTLIVNSRNRPAEALKLLQQVNQYLSPKLPDDLLPKAVVYIPGDASLDIDSMQESLTWFQKHLCIDFQALHRLGIRGCCRTCHRSGNQSACDRSPHGIPMGNRTFCNAKNCAATTFYSMDWYRRDGQSLGHYPWYWASYCHLHLAFDGSCSQKLAGAGAISPPVPHAVHQIYSAARSYPRHSDRPEIICLAGHHSVNSSRNAWSFQRNRLLHHERRQPGPDRKCSGGNSDSDGPGLSIQHDTDDSRKTPAEMA